MKSEGIEALVYPNPEYKNEAGEKLSDDDMKKRISKIIQR